MKRIYYTYDLETYPNIFTFAGKFSNSDECFVFEISARRNDLQALIAHLGYIRNTGVEMVGFNNLGFDYPILHELMTNPYTFDFIKAYQLAQIIIKGQFGGGPRMKRIRPNDRLIPQIDIFKVCHFDNKAKGTSLKALQFAMRCDSLEDLPFALRDLTYDEMDILREYNVHDVKETEAFFFKNEHHVETRREYLANGILRNDVLNFSDVKIGVEYLIARIGRNKCFSGSKPRQTFREEIQFKNIILPKIYFRTELFNEVLTWFKKQIYYVSGGERPKLNCDLAGLEFDFGVGGVHASVENKIFISNDTHQIIDIDVASMYPSVAIANRFAPEHLGETFLAVYKQIRADRLGYAKGTSQNAALKLALNGAYGNFNNPYSPLYDPQTMLCITINGQLQLLQLAEMLSLIPDLEIIQGNTDGITAYVPREHLALFKMWCTEWESMTGLVLEDVNYSRMWIRDVNNYFAETEDGKIKSKGAYAYPRSEKDYDGWWNKDYSNLASKIAAEKVMTDNYPIEIALKLVTNPFDFMLRYKTVGASKLYIGDEKQLKTVRYYVSKSGQPMKKVAPPKGEVGQYKRKVKLKDEYFNQIMNEIGKDVWDERIHSKNKSKYGIVETSVQAGWKVKQCNVATDFDWSDVDWNYYIEETKKLIIGSK